MHSLQAICIWFWPGLQLHWEVWRISWQETNHRRRIPCMAISTSTLSFVDVPESSVYFVNFAVNFVPFWPLLRKLSSIQNSPVSSYSLTLLTYNIMLILIRLTDPIGPWWDLDQVYNPMLILNHGHVRWCHFPPSRIHGCSRQQWNPTYQ